MLKIDNQFLIDLGLGDLPQSDKASLLQQIYETLQQRVGEELAAKMSEEQLEAFEVFVDDNDQAGAQKWLETNFPNYKDVVAAELNKLKDEIKVQSGEIKNSVSDPK